MLKTFSVEVVVTCLFVLVVVVSSRFKDFESESFSELIDSVHSEFQKDSVIINFAVLYIIL